LNIVACALPELSSYDLSDHRIVVGSELPVPDLGYDAVAEDALDAPDKNEIDDIAGVELDIETIEGLGGPVMAGF